MTDRAALFACLALLTLAAPGCGEDSKPSGDDAGDDGATPDANFADGDLVINEIRAVGDDWVELMNRGAADFDLEGFGVTDAANDGSPRLDRVVRFPAGVTLATDGFFVVVADQPANSTAVETDCLMGAVSECLFADWGISAANGDTVFVVDGDDNVVAKAMYPGNATSDAESWARVPDGSGAFSAQAPTPGAFNE